MHEPSISIAMCTYNGAAYLAEQLHSFVRQTRPPDELIVCDDASTDATIEIIEAFAAKAPFRVRIVARPRNIGRVSNFEQAVALCTGDIIFLSDQDDLWRADKIEIMSQKLVENPDAAGIFCDAEIVDAELRPLGRTVWQHCGFTPDLQEQFRRGDAFEPLLRSQTVQGSALAFRACYRPLLLQFSPEWGHDSWIAVLLAAVSRLLFVGEQLMSYRQHDKNLLGVMSAPASRAKRWMEKLRRPRRYYAAKLDAVSNWMRQLGDLEARLVAQNDPVRYDRLLAAVANRRRRLERQRRLIEAYLRILLYRMRSEGSGSMPATTGGG